MGQIIVRKMTLSDFILNRFYGMRYKFYAKYRKNKLKDWSPKEKVNRELVFDDDFNEISWSRSQQDERKWGIGEHWGSFHPRNGRSWWTEPLLNGDSTITLGTKYEPKTFHRKIEGEGYWYTAPTNFEPGEVLVVPYSVGGLSTAHKNTDNETICKQQYGRWELRAKVPTDPGIRSAYWTWGSTWPPEIDIFEIDGRPDHSDQKINFHYGKTADGTKDSLGSWDGNSLRLGEFQEFVMEWSPGKVELYTDGIKIFRLTNKKTMKWFDDPIAQMWVLIYQAVIGDIEHEPDEDGWYSKFVVDYVRVYK